MTTSVTPARLRPRLRELKLFALSPEGRPALLGALGAALIAAGGLLYTVGAVVYAAKRPDPSPRWFGFHEVFHAFTVAAFSSHWVAALLAVLGVRAAAA